MTSDLDRRAEDHYRPMDDTAIRPRWSHLFWPVILALAFVVYELTSQPGLGAAIACTKFGWDDFLTASWLYKRDPNRRRAHAELWLGVAVGLWKVAVTGIAVMFAAAFLEAAFRGPPAPAVPIQPPKTIAIALAVSFLGFAASTIATLRAFRLAWSNRQRLWYDKGLHWDRRADRWPPMPGASERTNQAGLVLLTALLVTGIALPVFGLVFTYFLMVAARAHFGWPLAWGEPVAGMVWLLLSLGLPIAMLIGRDVIGARVLARSPGECWDFHASKSASEADGHWHPAIRMR
jgi:hypothetical protein